MPIAARAASTPSTTAAVFVSVVVKSANAGRSRLRRARALSLEDQVGRGNVDKQRPEKVL